MLYVAMRNLHEIRFANYNTMNGWYYANWHTAQHQPAQELAVAAAAVRCN